MENTTFRFWLPVITFELIAGMTAIDQIIPCIAAAPGARLKVIQRQTCPGIGFANLTIAASKVIEFSDLLSQFGDTHDRFAPADTGLRISDN